MGQLIESLESRRMLAASGGDLQWVTSVSAYGRVMQHQGFTLTLNRSWTSDQFHVTKRGTLVVKGTDDAETLAVIRQGSTVTLWSNPDDPKVVATFTDGSVKRLLVEAGGGDDVIDVGGFGHPVTVAGGAGDDQLYGGRGSTLIGGGGDDLLLCGGDYSLPAVGDDSGIGELIDKTPSLMSGGAGRDTLVATIGAPDSLIGGTGSDTIVCTAKFPDTPAGDTPTGQAAADLLIAQDGAMLSGLETIDMRQRKAMTHADGTTFNSPFGVYGTIASGETGWLRINH